MEERVDVREVGLRDGLQQVKEILPVHRKKEWIRGALAAGSIHMEVTSFVPARIVPQFADAEEVVGEAIATPGLRASVLVPNLRGAERAFAAGVPQINYVISASEMHNQANVRRSTDESLLDFRRITAVRKDTAQHCEIIAGGIATAFGCTLQGAVSEARVIDIAEQLAAAGADEILLADTVGYADPYQVARLIKAVRAAVTPRPVACHFHDTRALGLANSVAALEAGMQAFDASIGGLGAVRLRRAPLEMSIWRTPCFFLSDLASAPASIWSVSSTFGVKWRRGFRVNVFRARLPRQVCQRPTAA
jgi:hydroxymethylglutaryl-CoA lyase